MDTLIGLFMWVVLAGAPLAALVAGVHAARRSRLHLADLGSLLLPPVCFFVVAVQREEVRTGWALFLWPIILLLIDLYAFVIKVALPDRFQPGWSRLSSATLLVVSCLLALVLAMTVGPWYE